MTSRGDDDFYALLGVEDRADVAELRRAWKHLALEFHPDRAGDDATAAFQRLSAAYAVLSDPVARAAYDRRRRRKDPSPRPDAAPGAPPRARRPAPAVMLTRLSGPLASLLACGVARFEEPGFITLVLRGTEAAQGGMATISLPVDLWCPDCAATDRLESCARCGGKRTVPELFSAWLSVPPGVTSGEVLVPSVELPGTVSPVRFRVRLSSDT